MLILAYLSMLIDHFGILFFPGDLIFRIIGRLALPIFVIRLCEGYKNTKNFNNYFLRILFIAIISQPLYYITFGFASMFELLNICFLLALGLMSIKILEIIKNKYGNFFFVIFLFIITSITYFLPIDYGAYGLLMILSVYYLRNDIIKFMIAITIISTILIPTFSHEIQYIPIVLFPILFYFDEKKFLNYNLNLFGFKYAHYTFYPLSILLLLILDYIF